MNYQSMYKSFNFEAYSFDAATRTATFKYNFDGSLKFEEKASFGDIDTYDDAVFQQALFLAYVIAGISYYKSFPTKQFDLGSHKITAQQADFFTTLYKNGLSQHVFENNLAPDDIGVFVPTVNESTPPFSYRGHGVSVLQSGGKDSLLLARLLQLKGVNFTAVYMQQSSHYPSVIDTVGAPVRRFRRSIDRAGLEFAAKNGGLNGHVPVTYITLAYALLDAILHNSDKVLAAIGREGEEPHAYIGDYAVTHQWSKTWHAEQLFASYVKDHVSPDIQVGSPLRGYTELKIAELFVENCWQQFSKNFSSCNVANYQQGHDNTELTWCGSCPKCANSYILFAPFVARTELNDMFNKDMYTDKKLTDTFKGLLGLDGYIKPFECVGEIAELRSAYWLSQSNGYPALPFEVSSSEFDRDAMGPGQTWASQMIQ